jgi:carboxymethylenebutenolidase
MCFEPDSHPPIAPVAGGALDSSRLTLTSAEGTSFSAFRTRAAQSSGAGILILPDVRGLHPYYEELALRFAESGIDALAIDYFGRTARDSNRDASFEYMPHVESTTFAGLSADVRAGADALRADGRVRSLFTLGFCFGGRLAFVTPTLGLGLAGAIGFYGGVAGPGRAGIPAPSDVVAEMLAPVLGLFGGADPGIPEASIETFRQALDRAEVEHELATYPGAPHSFFDRKADEFAEQSADAWQKVLAFIRSHTAPE